MEMYCEDWRSHFRGQEKDFYFGQALLEVLLHDWHNPHDSRQETALFRPLLQLMVVILARMSAETVGNHWSVRPAVLDMKVGNSLYSVELTRLGRGARHTMQVDFTDTYQEYVIQGLGGDGVHFANNVAVTSDDCCDYKCITVTEVDGEFRLQREPRVHRQESSVCKAEECSAAGAPKRAGNGNSSWKIWIGLIIF